MARARASRGFMVHDGPNWRLLKRRAALILSAAVLPFATLVPQAHAQSIMRTPSLHIDSRVPSINPTVAPRISPTIAGRDGGGIGTIAVGRTPPPTTMTRMDRPVGVGSSTPYLRYSHNLYPVCEYANRGPDGECFDRPVTSGGGGAGTVAAKKGGGSSHNSSQAANNLRTVPNEFVAEIDGAMSPADADALARSHGLERISSQNFPLVGGTIGLFRIIDRRPVDTVRREFAADAKVKSVQPNFRYVLQDQKQQDQKNILTEGDPAQYAVAQL